MDALKTAPIDKWAVPWRQVKSPRARLICLPHAGGGSTIYRPWADLVPPDIELIAIRLPGRETRYKEEPFTRLDELVASLVRALAPLLEEPHAWFGHSMGALIAYEACRAERDLHLGAAIRLAVSGRPAPHLPARQEPVHNAPRDKLLHRLRDTNGTPREILEDPAMLSALLPALRADLSVAETYRHIHADPLTCPISVFGATDDCYTTLDGIDAWRSHTKADCAVHLFSGDHFFVHKLKEQVVPSICADVLSAGNGTERN
jgi:medium-chain acyl-[acyl-carrier-protein] hydrolase